MDYMTMNFNRNGGSGTSDYSQLTNKPSINDVTLSGNKTSADLGLMPTRNIDLKPREGSQNFVFSGGVYEADEKIKSSVEGMDTVYTEDGTPVDLPSYDVIQETEMQFKPTQDLHGYDKPWAGGAGKNKLPYFTAEEKSGIRLTYDNGVVALDGTASANAFFILSNLNLTSNDYVFSANNDTANSGVHISLREIGASSDFADLPMNDTDKHNIYQNVSIGQVTLYVLSGTQLTDFRLPLQIEVGGSKTSFEPYSNICPISGQNNATLTDEYNNKYIASLGGTYYGGRVFFETSFYNQFWEYIASYNGETLSGEWISDRDEYIEGTTPTIGAEVAYRLDTTIGHRISVTREPLASGEITYNGSALYISYQKDNVIGECKKFTVDEIAKYKPFNYSTQEKIVGEWVDGKAVYQKTINLGELPNAALKVVAHGISNFGHIVGLEGYAQTGTASTSIPYISTSGIEYSITIDIDDTNIQIFTGSDRSNMSGYLTMRYTKTTD